MSHYGVSDDGSGYFHDDDWTENYVDGAGATDDDALAALKKDIRSMADSLWG